MAPERLGLLEGSDGKRVKVAGIISQAKKINTKNGQPMLFVGLEDLSGKAEVIVFPRLLQENPEAFQVDSLVVINGKISTKDNEIKILADRVEKLEPDQLQGEHIVTTSTDEDKIVEIDLGEEPEATQVSQSIEGCFEKGEFLCEVDGKIYVVLPKGTAKKQLVEIKTTFEKFPGDIEVVLAYKKDGDFQFAKTKMRIDLKDDLRREIKGVLNRS